MNEFDFIRRYLAAQKQPENGVALGIGDDAAIVRPGAGCDLHISCDMLVCGRHFFADHPPAALAHKIVAVNVSDMAAMGAKPRWMLLAAALPELDENWLAAFCDSLFAQARRYGISLIGGDTTRGSLCFSLTVIGEAPQGQALRRSGARVGDDIWVSGRIGLAAAALRHRLGVFRLPESLLAACQERLLRPEPRPELGSRLLGTAHAAQDISDGLAQDLCHILRASKLAAEIDAAALPSSPELKRLLPYADWLSCVLDGGDDYELLFTAPPAARLRIEQIGRDCAVPLSRIGHTQPENGADRLWLRENGRLRPYAAQGFDHFA